jgi:predicted CXXCH cytochrome family protein
MGEEDVVEFRGRKPKSLLVVAVVVLLVGGMTFMSLGAATVETGTEIARDTEFHEGPDQPINFFHSVHVGERKIECAYCHRTAETAAFAGMPSTQLCISCHRVVAPTYPEIWKLRSYWELGEAIPWERVNNLPDHAYFSHEAHLAGGKLDCTPCHGQVETMERVRQTAPLTMGWCLDCHRKQDASTECWACHR